jgi:hypothetical protein
MLTYHSYALVKLATLHSDGKVKNISQWLSTSVG